VVPVKVISGLTRIAELPPTPRSPGSFAWIFAAIWPFLFVAAEPAFREGFAAEPALREGFAAVPAFKEF
jgi:hypothetical protein